MVKTQILDYISILIEEKVRTRAFNKFLKDYPEIKLKDSLDQLKESTCLESYCLKCGKKEVDLPDYFSLIFQRYFTEELKKYLEQIF